jgi:hypothetical protein
MISKSPYPDVDIPELAVTVMAARAARSTR